MAGCTCSTARRSAAPITRRRCRKSVAVLERPAAIATGRWRRGGRRRHALGRSPPSSGPVHADTKFAMTNGAVTAGAIAAFTLVDSERAPTLQPQWTSRDIAAPVTPAVVNGVVFAIASGRSGASARRARSVPRRRCCTRWTRRRARSCGRAARRSRRPCAASGRRPATARSTWRHVRWHGVRVWHAAGGSAEPSSAAAEQVELRESNSFTINELDRGPR